MNFASLRFLLFLAVLFTVYWRLGAGRRVPLLLVAGYGFYALFDWRFTGVLALLSLLNFTCGARIHASRSPASRRAWLLVSVLGSLGVLAYVKYLGFFADSLVALLGAAGFRVSPIVGDVILPVGISYYVFQMLTYTLDIYRGQIQPTRSFITFATFSSFFAHIVAGPITRARELIPQLEKERRFDWADVETGLTRLLLGWFKKVFIADTLALHLVDPVFASPGSFGAGMLWLALLGYFVQVYADFSGYSSMAIGSARLLGIRIPENFRFPYLSTNIAEFWRRWHITLSRWLRDYVWWTLAKDIPFSGGLGVRLRSAGALLAVFLACGIWHGASWVFVLWGALHGVFIVTYEFWHRARNERGGTSAVPPVLRVASAWLVTQTAVLLSWLVFRSPDLGAMGAYIRGLAAGGVGDAARPDLPLLVWLALAAFAVDHLAGYLQETRPDLAGRIPAPVKAVVFAALVLLLFATRPEQVGQFIYFRF